MRRQIQRVHCLGVCTLHHTCNSHAVGWHTPHNWPASGRHAPSHLRQLEAIGGSLSSRPESRPALTLQAAKSPPRPLPPSRESLTVRGVRPASRVSDGTNLTAPQSHKKSPANHGAVRKRTMVPRGNRVLQRCKIFKLAHGVHLTRAKLNLINQLKELNGVRKLFLVL